MSERIPRKLAVIVHADVVESTSLVHMDEELAHGRIQNAFQRFSTTIAAHGGTTHEQRGDAIVAEFERASDAVSAALAFQRENERFNSGIEDEIKARLRIGISLGEVVIADETITGAGVVLAQRLEQLADAGGVCVQGAAFETVPKRLPFDFEDLGEQRLKGFEQPVRAYAVGLRPGVDPPAPESGVRMQSVKLELPDKPSIAVLPFSNMSGDPEQEYFTDGITIDIITELAKFRELFVIAQNTTFGFKGESVDIAEFASRLGVQYVVEGSVRKSGTKVRITAQLVDTLTGKEIWAERYDGDLEDIFRLQDDVVTAIVAALPSRIRHAELERSERRSFDLRAYDLVQRAWQLMWTRSGVPTAKELAERALEIEPNYGSAHAALVGIYLLYWRRCWNGSPEETLKRALEHGRQAVTLDETDYTGHWFLSEVYLFRLKDLEKAKVHAERAMKVCPNASGPTAWMGFIHGCFGEHERGIELCSRAMRRDPLAPDYLQYLTSCVHFNARNYEEAIKGLYATEWFSMPELLSAAYAKVGRLDEARELLASHIESIRHEMARVPEDWFEYFAERCPYVRKDDIEHYLSSLRAALSD